MVENKLADQFAAYSTWRKALIDTICDYRSWLNEQELNDAQVDLRVQHLLDRLNEDKLNAAFECRPYDHVSYRTSVRIR